MPKVDVIKSGTGYSILVDGVDVAAFGWVRGLPETAMDEWIECTASKLEQMIDHNT